jgi:putative thioredoxin
MAEQGPHIPLSGGYDLSALVERARNKDKPPQPASGAYVRDVSEAEMGSLIELSNQVPVILEVYGQGVEPQLASLINSYQGKLVLATLDAQKAPELVQALQITGVPTVFAIIQGRPAPLFQGQAPDDQIRQVFDQVLQVAAQAGVTGVMPAPNGEPSAGEGENAPEEKPLSPEHQRAYDALSRNDLDGAEAAYQEALKKAPADQDAKAGLANVGLMRRLAGRDANTIRSDAGGQPGNLEAQMLVADLDVAGGHLDDAFRRLLGLYPTVESESQDLLRQRLLEYFDIAGPTHPSVLTARQALASLLY